MFVFLLLTVTLHHELFGYLLSLSLSLSLSFSHFLSHTRNPHSQRLFKVLGHAYPEAELVTECPGTTCWPPLDVSRNSTLQFVRELWNDFGVLFPGIFLGT